jgi:hypothetical protein
LFGSDTSEKEYDHGETLKSGDQFPENPNDGTYFVRTDFNPKRLFVFRGSRWHRLYDNITEDEWSNKTYNAGEFINNNNTTVVDNQEFEERQPLSSVIKPKSDFE